MEINFELAEKDYLNFQLYHTSESRVVRRQRRVTQLVVVLTVVATAIYFFVIGDNWIGAYFLVGAIPSFFLCSFYTKLLYRFSLRSHVASIYRRSMPRTASLSVNGDELIYHEQGYVKHKKTTDIQEIIDVPNYIYLKFSEASYVIIPKKELSDPDYVAQRLKDIADNYDIKYVYSPRWKWR